MTKTPLKLKSTAPAVTAKSRRHDWRILIVDDEPEVHAVTRLILEKMRYKERGIELLSAYSAAEGRRILEQEKGIAVILLDVVMETDDAGLRLAQVIREDLDNLAIRIILRTGQPGQAPEKRIIVDYDINDYKAKSELSAQKLFTSIVVALRSFETITSLDKTRKGMEKILDSTHALFQVHSLQQFASGVLTQLSVFLDCQPNGILCAQFDPDNVPDGGGSGLTSCVDLNILACTGEYSDCMECSRDQTCVHKDMIDLIRKSLVSHANQFTNDFTILYLDAGDTHHGAVALLHGGSALADESDRQLLKIFSDKISIAMANALHYQKMISAESAATTDFLTGLANRRQLLRLGVPLVAGAYRSNTVLAVAMLDIDHFKRINDTWGHDAGDEVLRRIGALLQDRFRDSDVVARVGGEEFCIIATGLTSETAFELFDHFRLLLEAEVFEFKGEKVSVTISIGVTLKTVDNIDAMICSADAMLYRAKKEGRNRVLLD